MGIILHLLVIAFAVSSNFQAHFKNKNDNPIFILVKIINNILVYTIPKSETLFNPGNFNTGQNHDF